MAVATSASHALFQAASTKMLCDHACAYQRSVSARGGNSVTSELPNDAATTTTTGARMKAITAQA